MPKTRLRMVGTPYCTILYLWMDFGDGCPVFMPQLWVASPPCVPVRLK